tara:strand:- start:81 stop:536 length:456 start_codon:yes stop_codon:yes gene_type:complete
MPELEENKKTFTPTNRISNFVKNAFPAAGIEGKVKTLGFIPLSSGFLMPGDVIAFNYKAEGAGSFFSVVALIVQTKASSGIRFARGSKNMLITCFKLEDTEESKDTLRALYKDRVNAKIDNLPTLDSYKTYIMNSRHISNLMELTLREEDL